MSIIESLYRNVIILKINNCNKKFVKAKNNVFGHILLVYFFLIILSLIQPSYAWHVETNMDFDTLWFFTRLLPNLGLRTQS